MIYNLKYKEFYLGKNVSFGISPMILIKKDLGRAAVFLKSEEKGLLDAIPDTLFDEDGNLHKIDKSLFIVVKTKM
jgi:hypothetical protein